MNKLSSLLTTVLFIATSLCLNSGNLLADDQILAHVNGQAITTDMMTVLSGSRQQGPFSGLEQNHNELLDSLITTELLFNEAKKIKLDANKQISMELALAHKTLLSQFYVKRYMDQLEFDEAALKAAYDAQTPHVMVRMAYKAFDNKRAAEAFLLQAKTGQAGAVADSEELPWQALENYPFGQFPEAHSLTGGAWLSVPTEDETGWLVWHCLERSAIPKPPYEDSLEGIKQELAAMHLQKHIENLRAHAQIHKVIQGE